MKNCRWSAHPAFATRAMTQKRLAPKNCQELTIPVFSTGARLRTAYSSRLTSISQTSTHILLVLQRALLCFARNCRTPELSFPCSGV